MAFAKKVNKNGSTIQKNLGATIHMKTNAISAIKKYNQYFPAGLVVSILLLFWGKSKKMSSYKPIFVLCISNTFLMCFYLFSPHIKFIYSE